MNHQLWKGIYFIIVQWLLELCCIKMEMNDGKIEVISYLNFSIVSQKKTTKETKKVSLTCSSCVNNPGVYKLITMVRFVNVLIFY